MANTPNSLNHRFKPGDRVMFPNREQLSKIGWVYDPIRRIMHNPKAPTFISRIMLQIAAGEEVQIASIINHAPGCYRIASDQWWQRVFTWPLDFTCMDSATSSDLDHTCTRGQTPIGDFWICKICGRDMERFR